MFDSSNYLENSNFQDAIKDIQIIQFGRLKAKMYSFRNEYDNENKQAKGINKDVIKQ